MAVGRVRAALRLNRKVYPALLLQGGAVYTGMEGNPLLFPNPNPALPVLLQQLQDAQKAHALVGTGVHGASAVRTVKVDILVSSLESECMYVQVLCDASPAQAASLIAAANMKVVAIGSHPKPLLAALAAGLPSGTVYLDANASLLDKTSRLKFYQWEYTLNGGQTFLPMPPTPGAKTSIANLPPLTMVGFRVCVCVINQPQGAWSQTVTTLVR